MYLVCMGTLCRYPLAVLDYNCCCDLKMGGTRNATMLKESIAGFTEILAAMFLRLARL
jgi:hypothetical protein